MAGNSPSLHYLKKLLRFLQNPWHPRVWFFRKSDPRDKIKNPSATCIIWNSKKSTAEIEVIKVQCGFSKCLKMVSKETKRGYGNGVSRQQNWWWLTICQRGD
jgi:hypothetical protein